MAIDKDSFLYTHLDSDIATVADFLNENATNPLSIVRGWDRNEFFKYKGGTNLSNEQRIYSAYSKKDQEDLEIKRQLITSSLEKIDFGTVLILPKNQAFIDTFAISGVNQIVPEKSVPMFMYKILLDLHSNAKWAPVQKYKINSGIDGIRDEYPNLTVWIWSKALGESDDDLDGKLINVTPFVINCSTNMDDNGGDFSFELAPIMGVIGENGRWTVDTNSMQQMGGEFVSQSFINQMNVRTKRPVRSPFFFHNILRENDVVFIRFETLELEMEDANLLKNSFIISPSNIPSRLGVIRNYDMIGLVDKSIKNASSENNDVVINISGRDLTKLIVEDGCYFYPQEFVQNNITIQNDSKKLLNRYIAQRGYELMSRGARRPIKFLIQFVVNYLATIGVVPNDLFSAYGDRRSKLYVLEKESLEKEIGDSQLLPVQGIWQIIKFVIDESVSSRRVTDASISQEDNSILTYFQKICQYPFVEFYGDTYGDEYVFTIRKPPFTKEAIQSYLNNNPTSSSEQVEATWETTGGVVSGNNIGATIDTVVVSGRSEIDQSDDIVISIDEADVLSETLQFHDDDFYTSFLLDSKEVIGGIGQSSNRVYLPMVVIPEYVEIWGSRRWKVTSNYMTHSSLNGQGREESIGYMYAQALNDLKYIIDSTIYLPFVRKGTITINGDRRIKRGTFIRYRPTGEIFYVDQVAQQISISRGGIDRTTTLTVSRGMKELYIDGVYVEGIGNVSYFNIVDTEVIVSSLGDKIVGKSENSISVKKTFSTNKRVMNYFMQNRQMK